MGCHRMLGIERTKHPHPSIGGTHGYDVAFQMSEIAYWELGLPTTASKHSFHHWRNQLDPYLMNGNDESEKIVGLDLYHMYMFLLAWSEAKLDEVVAFIANT